jgi:hypothetical protein
MIKLAGAVELELFDLSRVAEDQRLGRWEFSAEDVREHWHRGFLSAGYLFQLDWQRVPTSSELTLHARLVAPDNRRFDATTQIKINPPGSAAPPVAQARQREPRPIAPPDEPPLLPPPVERTAMPERARTANRVPSRRTSRTAQRPEIRPGPSSAPETPAVDTSDNWTEQTIPYLR